MVAPVVVVGVDVVAGDELVAGFADDGDGVDGDQDQYRGVRMGASDAEVVQAAGVAQGEFAELVDGVVADAEVFEWLARWVGFGSGEVGLFGCALAFFTGLTSLSFRLSGRR